MMEIKKILNKVSKILILLGIIVFIGFGVNLFFGWFGHKPWEMRRSTFGKISESQKREVFVKKLTYRKQIEDTMSINFYIEKGYKWGYFSSDDTRLISNTNFPYQIPYPIELLPKNISFIVQNESSLDSIFNYSILLKEPKLQDTLTITIKKYDSINYIWNMVNIIHIWDNTIEK